VLEGMMETLYQRVLKQSKIDAARKLQAKQISSNMAPYYKKLKVRQSSALSDRRHKFC